MSNMKLLNIAIADTNYSYSNNNTS